MNTNKICDDVEKVFLSKMKKNVDEFKKAGIDEIQNHTTSFTDQFNQI